jgi:hypothetical protein
MSMETRCMLEGHAAVPGSYNHTFLLFHLIETLRKSASLLITQQVRHHQT